MSKFVALILAGGVGTRLGADIPKQYIEVGGKPIFLYCTERFAKNERISNVVIAAAKEWIPFIEEWLSNAGLETRVSVITGGSSRNHTIQKGFEYFLEAGYPEDTVVLFHDAVRAGISSKMIADYLDAAQEVCGFRGLTSGVPVKDTIFVSNEGNRIDGLLKRSTLLAGYTPEVYPLGSFYELFREKTEEELAVMTSGCEMAFRNGWDIRMIPGEESNYKITTKEDMLQFRYEVEVLGKYKN